MNIDAVAEAIYRAHTEGISGYFFMPPDVRGRYYRMAQAAIEALGLTEEKHNALITSTKSESGGQGVFRYSGQTATHEGYGNFTRLVSPWVRSG